MVTDAATPIAETIHLENRASKGKTGGRTIPMHPDVHAALVTLQTWRGDAVGPDRPIIFSERGGGLSPATVRLWFHRLYTSLKMDGCSSHSGRRTFITRAARKVSQVGGSLRDVQELAGHTSLAMTQRYIEGESEAQARRAAVTRPGAETATCTRLGRGPPTARGRPGLYWTVGRMDYDGNVEVPSLLGKTPMILAITTMVR